jgi:tetratricopeptide (TPR) repeat protein
MQYSGEDDYEGYPILDAEWDFISAALPRLLIGDNNRLQMACSQLSKFLDFTGRWDDQLWFLEQAELRASTSDKENAGWRAYQVGWVYNRRHQPAKVLACAARAAEHWQDSIPRNKANAIRLLGLGHKLNKEYPAAIADYREALEIYRSISPENVEVARILNDLANVEQINKEYHAAERNYREAIRIAKIFNYREGISFYTGDLAALALDREQWAEAESLAREALALAEKVGRQELIAGVCHRLAKALLMQNKNLDEALSLSRRAVEIYTRLRHRNLQFAQETVEEIEKALGG